MLHYGYMAIQPQPLPDHITPYAFDFRWDNSLLWQLNNIPTEKMDINDLVWHFDIPWLHTSGERFNLTPRDIMSKPSAYSEEYTRTMNADTNYPIDIMFNKNRWLILDGLHRLMKLVDQGETKVTVRKIPREMIPRIVVKSTTSP